MMNYRFCGHSGLQLPLLSLGLWHNFGEVDNAKEAANMLCYAFEQGITHFDLANMYGPPPGSAEVLFGKVLREQLSGHRHQMVIATKAGHQMWAGPYGEGGSRKHIMASIDQSLTRMGIDYVDIFYSHRYDPHTPIEETVRALADVVRQGKALYVGISKYPPVVAERAYTLLKQAGVPCLVHQDKYSMLVREPEQGVLPQCKEHGVGFVAFSPLAQGLLTAKYQEGIPADSRAFKAHGFLKTAEVTEQRVHLAAQLAAVAKQRGQSLAQMALAWLLKDTRVTSLIIGASSLTQLQDNLASLQNLDFASQELQTIETLLQQS